MNATSALTLSQLNLGVSDLDLSERFYRDVLDLPTQRVGESIVVAWPSFTLKLTARPPADRGKFCFAFRVESRREVDEWAFRLRAAKVDMVSGPADDGPLRELSFVDPDNYEIEIFFEA